MQSSLDDGSNQETKGIEFSFCSQEASESEKET